MEITRAPFHILEAKTNDRIDTESHWRRLFSAFAALEVAANSFGWRINDITNETEALFRD